MTAENAPELKPEALTDEDEAAAVAASQPLEMDPVFGPMLGGLQATPPAEPAEVAPAEAPLPPAVAVAAVAAEAAPVEPVAAEAAGTPRPLLRAIRDVDGDTIDVEPAAFARTQVFEPEPEPYRDPIVDFRTPARRRLASLVGK